MPRVSRPPRAECPAIQVGSAYRGVSGNCTDGQRLGRGESCSVACSQGYTPASPDPALYTYTCGADGSLSSIATGVCEPGRYRTGLTTRMTMAWLASRPGPSTASFPSSANDYLPSGAQCTRTFITCAAFLFMFPNPNCRLHGDRSIQRQHPDQELHIWRRAAVRIEL
jgi:hypothetical protein